MHATVGLQQGYLEKTDTLTTRTPATVTTTLYDLMMLLQSVYGPDNDDLVVPLVAYWLRSGHITLPGAARRAAAFAQGGCRRG